MKERLGGWIFLVASITFILCWLLFALFFHSPASQGFFILGNITSGVGVLLILLAMSTLRRRGELIEAKNFTTTTLVVKRGIYSVVRHPLYFGWLLTYPAAMLVSQHWLIIVLGVIGMMSMVQITKMADIDLVAKFGLEYEKYMQEVPRLNIILGITRKLKRRISGSENAG